MKQWFCHINKIFDLLSGFSDSSYSIEYELSERLKPSSVQAGCFIVNNALNEQVNVNDVLYFPQTNTVRLNISGEDVYKHLYSVQFNNLQNMDNDNISGKVFAYANKLYNCQFNMLSLLKSEYYSNGIRVNRLYGEDNVSIVATIVNSSGIDYNDIEVKAILNNNDVLAIGHLDLKRDSIGQVELKIENKKFSKDDIVGIIIRMKDGEVLI